MGEWLAAVKTLIIAFLGTAWIWMLKIDAEKEFFVGAARAFFQLLFASVVFAWVFKQNVAVAWAVIGAMVAVGIVSVRRRAKGFPKPWLLSAAGLVAGFVAGTLAMWISGFLEPSNPRNFIPLCGIILGNSLMACSRGFMTVRTIASDRMEIVEAMLLDGAPLSYAARFLAKDALRIAILPNIDRMKVVGIIHIPGAMAGMMLSGEMPLRAVAYQLAIIYALAIATVAASGTVVYGALFLSAKRGKI